jgi:hypothetical protein
VIKKPPPESGEQGDHALREAKRHPQTTVPRPLSPQSSTAGNPWQRFHRVDLQRADTKSGANFAAFVGAYAHLCKSSYELVTAFSYRPLTLNHFEVNSADAGKNRCYKGVCDPEATSRTEQPSCQR